MSENESPIKPLSDGAEHMPPLTRDDLRRLVDIVSCEVMEQPNYLMTRWQDEMINKMINGFQP